MRKFDASLLIKNIIYGSVKVILPFLFSSDQTRLDFGKLYAYSLSSTSQYQQIPQKITFLSCLFCAETFSMAAGY